MSVLKVKPRPSKSGSRTVSARRATAAIFSSAIKLSARDSKRVLKDLATPPPSNEALKKAAARYKKSAKKS